MNNAMIAIDIGASSGRHMLGQVKNGRLELTELYRFPNGAQRKNGRLCWDIDRLFAEILNGLRTAKAQGITPRSVAIDTWGVDFGLIAKNGKLLSNPVHYRDARTHHIPDEVFGILSGEEIYRRTGIQTMHFNTLYQLYYLAHYEPDLLAMTDKILMMPDLFAYFLTGKKRIERTNASTTNFLNPVTREWDTELLEKLGIPTGILPELIEAGDTYGRISPEMAQELGVGEIPVIAVCTHDTGSAVAAAPASGDFAYISCGTWSLFGTELEKPLITEASAAVQYTNEGGYRGTIRFLKNIMGLWLIQESRREWIRRGEEVTFSDLEREALGATPFLSFIDVDDRLFESAGDLPGRVVEYCRRTGQTVPATRGEIMRCIYQSLAMKYKYTFENLVRMTGVRYPHIHMLGGGIKDTLLCRMTAAATGATVLAGPTEATVMGNIAVQMIALGEIPSWQAARGVIGASTPLATYAPEDTAAWDKAYETYLRVIKK